MKNKTLLIIIIFLLSAILLISTLFSSYFGTGSKVGLEFEDILFVLPFVVVFLGSYFLYKLWGLEEKED